MDAELTVSRLAKRFDEEYPDHAVEWVADRAVRSIKAAERTALLAALLAERIEDRRRATVRSIEREAATVPAVPENRETWEAEPWFAPRNSRAYRQWTLNTPEGQRAEALRIADRDARAEKDRLRREDPDEFSRRFGWGAFVRSLEAFRSEVRLELTAELLGSSFALGDGRLTTWGQASVADHQQRIALLMRGIEGSGRTVALHEKAIELLVERDAQCLTEVRFAA